MATIQQVLFYSFIGGVISLAGGILLLSSKKGAVALARYATPFAGGALLAAVFLDLLKEGVEQTDAGVVLMAALAGIILFFFAEGFLRWFHHHHEHEDSKQDPNAWLVVLGDTLHNLLDGVAIGAAFLVSVPTGIVTTIAVAAHEIPQEIGDFGLLLSKGMSRKFVIVVNIVSALATVIAAVTIFTLGSETGLPIGVPLGLSAGFLLYIAMSDIIPTIHSRKGKSRQFKVQSLLLILGVLVVGLVTNLAHEYIGDDHSHDNGGTHSPAEDHDDDDDHSDEDDHSAEEDHSDEEDHNDQQ
jgi:zinc and cadmium transporter